MFEGFRSRCRIVLLVGVVDGPGDLLDVPRRLVVRQRAAVDHLGEVAALDVPHRVEEAVAVLAGVEDRDDVVVLEPRRELPLEAEPRLRRRVVEPVRPDHLQRHGPPERGVVDAVDGAHAPLADQAEHLVRADLRRRRRRRGRRGRARGTGAGSRTPRGSRLAAVAARVRASAARRAARPSATRGARRRPGCPRSGAARPSSQSSSNRSQIRSISRCQPAGSPRAWSWPHGWVASLVAAATSPPLPGHHPSIPADRPPAGLEPRCRPTPPRGCG